MQLVMKDTETSDRRRRGDNKYWQLQFSFGISHCHAVERNKNGTSDMKLPMKLAAPLQEVDSVSYLVLSSFWKISSVTCCCLLHSLAFLKRS